MPRRSAVNALKFGEGLRSASPCSPDGADHPAAGIPRRGRGNARRAEGSCSSGDAASEDGRREDSERGGASSRGSSSAVEEVAHAPPRKKPRLKAATPLPQELSPAASASTAKTGGTPDRRVISAADEGTFQAAVLEKLWAMCGEHEDAKVLAEYIVVMIAGNKSREEMSVELKPFFQDQVQAESFIDWVEECKWKFLTGGPSPQKPEGSGQLSRQASTGSSRGSLASPMVSKRAAATSGDSPRTAAEVLARARLRPGGGAKVSSSQPAVKRGPHVAVTSRVVLQPNPSFSVAAPALTAASVPEMAPSPQARGALTARAAPTVGSLPFSKAAAASMVRSSSGGNPVKR